jgi:transposase
VRELVKGDAELAALTTPLLRVHGQLATEALAFERRLVDEARHDPVCRRLTSVPGVGPITALPLTSTVDDLSSTMPGGSASRATRWCGRCCSRPRTCCSAGSGGAAC